MSSSRACRVTSRVGSAPGRCVRPVSSATRRSIASRRATRSALPIAAPPTSKITTTGRQAHTTYKHLGVNAIETMEPILAGLRELESTLAVRTASAAARRTDPQHRHHQRRHQAQSGARSLHRHPRHPSATQPGSARRETSGRGDDRRSTVRPSTRASMQSSSSASIGCPGRDIRTRSLPTHRSCSRSTARSAPSPGLRPVYQGVPFWCDLVALDRVRDHRRQLRAGRSALQLSRRVRLRGAVPAGRRRLRTAHPRVLSMNPVIPLARRSQRRARGVARPSQR